MAVTAARLRHPFPEAVGRGFVGLTNDVAAERLRRDGFNELPTAARRSLMRIALDVLREPMILLLVSCGAVYLLLGDLREAIVLLISVFVVISISLYQSQKTERALEALRTLSSPRALVIRDQVEKRIAGREVVAGDLIVLREGDRVPADGLVLWSMNLTVDESLLTGESIPVRKTEGRDDGELGRPGGDNSPCAFSGTLVVAGQGVARVKATGARTALGRIGTALETTQTEQTTLERETGRMVRILAIVALAVCAVVVTFYGMHRQNFLEGFLAGLALALSMMPEEFPVILTIFLALGAWRLSQRKVLTRRLPAIEALGAATVACVDKTGTITQNRMALGALWVDGCVYDVQTHSAQLLPEQFHPLVEFALLASQQNPFDPMERSINEFGRHALAGTEHLHAAWELVQEYPLSRELLAMSQVWRARAGDNYVVAAKGAPEAICDLCHLDDDHTRIITTAIAGLADRGFRLLGVARGTCRAPLLPPVQHDFIFEFLGLIALADPIRPNIAAAVRECARAGIRTVMLTGDYAGTARHVAAQIGLPADDAVLTGPEVDRLSDQELSQRIRRVNVFARVVPEQKLRLVHALQANGEVVAMTGDGVNDAPALKAAHIGIAMGERGTDVAREAAALVLLDDDFSSIVAAVRLGRRVLDNIRKAMAYVLAIHVPIAGLSLVSVLLDWPLILLPVHIVFLELVIDPACSIVFEAEPEEGDVMNRPPRPATAPLFDRPTVVIALLQGTLALLLAIGILLFARSSGYGEERTRMLAFSALIMMNLGLILANRSRIHNSVQALRVKNRALGWVSGLALLILTLSLASHPGRAIFRFASPSLGDLGLIAGTAALAVFGFDVLKWSRRTEVRKTLPVPPSDRTARP